MKNDINIDNIANNKLIDTNEKNHKNGSHPKLIKNNNKRSIVTSASQIGTLPPPEPSVQTPINNKKKI
eukprot:UN28317